MRKGYELETTCFVSLMGFAFVANVALRVTYWGFAGSYFDAPEGPEYEIDSIRLALDEPGREDAPEFEATGALFELLAERFDERLCEKIGEQYQPTDYDD